MTYVQYIQPVLLGLGLIVALILLLAGRTKVTVEKFEKQVQVTRLARGAFKRSAIAAAVTLVVISSLAIVPAGYRGVVYSAAGGVSLEERPEGFSFLIPLAQHVVPVNVRTQKFFTAEAFAQTLDLQEVTLHVSVNFHVDPLQAAELYREVGTTYADTVVSPAVLQLVKERIGLVEAPDFASHRSALATDIRDSLTSQLGGYGIVVEYVNIEDAVFDPAFVQAVKEKIIAEQEVAEQQRLIEAEAAKKEQAILQAEGRAASVLIEAEAQAEANRQIAATLTTDLVSWQEILRWNGVLPTTLVTNGTSSLLIQPS